MRGGEIRQSFFVTIGQDNAVSHASAGPSAYVGRADTRTTRDLFSSVLSTKTQKSRIKCGIFRFWRRGQDSNLRYVAVHNISNVAPSTTQTPLQKSRFRFVSLYII